jgi:hypothetical protein
MRLNNSSTRKRRWIDNYKSAFEKSFCIDRAIGCCIDGEDDEHVRAQAIPRSTGPTKQQCCCAHNWQWTERHERRTYLASRATSIQHNQDANKNKNHNNNNHGAAIRVDTHTLRATICDSTIATREVEANATTKTNAAPIQQSSERALWEIEDTVEVSSVASVIIYMHQH